MTDHHWCERVVDVHEGRREGESCPEDQSDRISDLETCVLTSDENAGGSERVQAQETARGEKAKRDQQHPGIAAAVRRGAGGNGKHDYGDAQSEKGSEMNAVVGPIRIKSLAQ
jgi:hypothetical protein